MIRAVLAVALAVALLGVSLPAVEDVAIRRTNEEVRTALARFAGAAERLAATNDPAPGAGTGARTTVTVHVPEPGWGAAPATVHVGACPGRADLPAGDRLCWRVDDGTLHRRRTGVALRGDLTLGPGRHRLRLRLVGRDRVAVAEV